ncbi:reverse transcriptase domain-containing protein [Tanacetum coccineum]
MDYFSLALMEHLPIDVCLSAYVVLLARSKEKELLAVVYAFEKFRPYLVLSKTIVYTDHSTLKYLLAKQDAKPRLLRWISLSSKNVMSLSSDKKRAKNVTADHLSRLENPHQSVPEKKEITKTFPLKTLRMVLFAGGLNHPGFADIANYTLRRKFIKPFVSSRLDSNGPTGEQSWCQAPPLKKVFDTVSLDDDLSRALDLVTAVACGFVL